MSIFNVVATENVKNIGNQAGQSQFADGPGAVIFNVGDCRFSINLGRHDHVQFNDPEVVLYNFKGRFDYSRLPYLDQARMSTGYDWSFKKNSNLSDKWFGMMCESVEDFPWNRPMSSDGWDISPGVAQIFEANSSRCPANPLDGRWILRSNEVGVLFKEIRGRDWSGFVVGYQNKWTKRSLEYIKFCIIHNKNVIVGASESSEPLNINVGFFDKVIELLSTVNFFDKN
ncbi:hypothetical protein [Cupriavidus pauculus]|uniref:hypothetical protein n=1 Tax=Cupriavidus pauculus TaxID=82633 RepID=UPI0038573682